MSQPDPNAQSGSDDTQRGDDDGQTEATGSNGQRADSETGATDEAKEPTVSRADFERIREQLRAADKKRNELETAYKQLVEKDLPEQEKLKTQLAEVQARAEKAETELREARINNAFLKESKYKWKNPATALKLADLSNVEIDDDGSVRNLTGALEALAKSDPYLLDSDDSKEEPKGSTGAPAGNGRAGGSGTNVSALASRIPALRSRGIGTK